MNGNFTFLDSGYPSGNNLGLSLSVRSCLVGYYTGHHLANMEH